VLEVEFTGQRGRVATRSGQNVTEAEKLVVNISSTKRSEVIVNTASMV